MVNKHNHCYFVLKNQSKTLHTQIRSILFATVNEQRFKFLGHAKKLVQELGEFFF